MKIGQNIYQARKRKGISQEELASKLEVSRQSISLWETDQTVPTLDKLHAISKLLEISMDELTGNKPITTLSNNELQVKRLEELEKQKLKSLVIKEKVFFYLSILSFLLWPVLPFGLLLSVVCIIGNVILFLKKQKELSIYSLIICIVAFIAAIIGL